MIGKGKFCDAFPDFSMRRPNEREKERWREERYTKKTDGMKKGNSCIDMYRVVCLLYNIQHSRREREGHKKEENTTILFMYIRRFFYFQKKRNE